MTKRYFVFIPGLRGLEGQILNELPTTGEGTKKVNYLFGPELIDDETLDECIFKFKDRIDVQSSG